MISTAARIALATAFAALAATQPATAGSMSYIVRGVPQDVLYYPLGFELRWDSPEDNLYPWTEQVTVTLTSDTDSIEMQMYETGPNTGLFVGYPNLSWFDVVNFPESLKIEPEDSVIATVGDTSVSIPVIPASVRVLDAAGRPTSIIPPNGVIEIEVIDHFYQGSIYEGAVDLEIVAGGTSVNWLIYETAPGSNIFRGAVPTSLTGAGGLLAAPTGTVVEIRHSTSGSQPIVESATVVGYHLEFVDADLKPLESYLANSGIRLRVRKDPALPQLPVTVALTNNPDQETLLVSGNDTLAYLGTAYQGIYEIGDGWLTELPQAPQNVQSPSLTATMGPTSIVLPGVRARATFFDEAGREMKALQSKSAGTLRLELPTLDTTPYRDVIHVVSVNATGSVDDIAQETDGSSGIFTTPIYFPGFGLPLGSTQEIYVTELGLASPILTQTIEGPEFNFTDPAGRPTAVVNATNQVRVQVYDRQVGTPAVVNTVVVSVWGLYNGNIVLTETGPDTHLFVGTLPGSLPSTYSTLEGVYFPQQGSGIYRSITVYYLWGGLLEDGQRKSQILEGATLTTDGIAPSLYTSLYFTSSMFGFFELEWLIALNPQPSFQVEVGVPMPNDEQFNVAPYPLPGRYVGERVRLHRGANFARYDATSPEYPMIPARIGFFRLNGEPTVNVARGESIEVRVESHHHDTSAGVDSLEVQFQCGSRNLAVTLVESAPHLFTGQLKTTQSASLAATSLVLDDCSWVTLSMPHGITSHTLTADLRVLPFDSIEARDDVAEVGTLFWPQGNDVTGPHSTFEIVQLPQHGTLIETPWPETFSYEPSASFPGSDTIRYRLHDTAGNYFSEATVVILPDSPPTLTASLGGPATVASQDEVQFIGQATDPVEGDLSHKIKWFSSLDGYLGQGATYQTMSLSIGNHVITAEVTDLNGNTTTATVMVEVKTLYTVTYYSLQADDGYLVESGENTNTASSASGTALRVGDENQDKQFRSILSFDTAPLPDNVVIHHVILQMKRKSLVGTTPFRTNGALLVDVKTGVFGNIAGLEFADFAAAPTAAGVCALEEAWADNTWSGGFFNEAGEMAINRVGKTQVRVYFSLDDNDDRGDDYLVYYSSDNTVNDNKPRLIVAYTLP